MSKLSIVRAMRPTYLVVDVVVVLVEVVVLVVELAVVVVVVANGVDVVVVLQYHSDYHFKFQQCNGSAHTS